MEGNSCPAAGDAGVLTREKKGGCVRLILLLRGMVLRFFCPTAGSRMGRRSLLLALLTMEEEDASKKKNREEEGVCTVHLLFRSFLVALPLRDATEREELERKKIQEPFLPSFPLCVAGSPSSLLQLKLPGGHVHRLDLSACV